MFVVNVRSRFGQDRVGAVDEKGTYVALHEAQGIPVRGYAKGGAAENIEFSGHVA
jgi:hypothetical protein